MGNFMDTAFGFPTALFSFALVVVVAYWVLVLCWGLDAEALDFDVDTGADGGVLAGAGLSGVPASVAVSLLVVLAWFTSLVGAVLTQGVAHGGVRVPVGVGVLVGALGVAWLGSRLLVLPLRRVFRYGPGPSLVEFVGLPCVIRTGTVRADFGQAEVTAPDGSSALVQVRVPPGDMPVAGAARLSYGSTALIFDYDPAGEFFLVMPYGIAP